ncbi:hypothetical protein MRX96_049485 [Rhipicephalus microplus]
MDEGSNGWTVSAQDYIPTAATRHMKSAAVQDPQSGDSVGAPPFDDAAASISRFHHKISAGRNNGRRLPTARAASISDRMRTRAYYTHTQAHRRYRLVRKITRVLRRPRRDARHRRS